MIYLTLLKNVGAGEVALTDGADEIVELAAYNVKNNFPLLFLKSSLDANFMDGYNHIKPGNKLQHVSVAQLKWDNAQDIERLLMWGKSDNKDGKYDYVLASEVFYKRENIDKLLRTMKELIKPKSEGGMVLLRLTKELTDEARGFDYLSSKMKEFGFKYKFYDNIDRFILTTDDKIPFQQQIDTEDSFEEDYSQLVVMYL